MAGILALDVGTTAVTVCLFSSGLFPERRSVREYGLRTEGNRVECDGETYLEAIREGIREVLREGEIPEAVGLTTQGETLTVAGGDGVPLRPFLVWLDQRAEAEAELLRADFPEALFYRETGLPGATGALPLAKVMWLKKREPELFGSGKRILLLEDWLLHFLTGRFVTEKTLQTSTGWFSLGRDGWWPEAMQAAGLREEELPELRESGSRAGEVTGPAAEALGLPRGTPVYTGAMDQVAASYAMDRLRPGAVTETTGTALTVAAVLPGHEEDFKQIRALNARRRAAFAEALSTLGAEVHPSEANFLLCDFGRDMRPAIEELRRQRILVRPCGMFPGLTHGHVRLCVRTEAENARLIEALGRL